jgi:NAD(P)-dependent dehydrogenase (short-subunit alcohol dehydrogenase family)
MTTPFDLGDKVAIVTGSSRGIGRASAEAMARLGAKVVVSSRKADACEAMARGSRIRRGGGGRSLQYLAQRRGRGARGRDTVHLWGGLPASVPQSAGLRHVRPSGSQRAWG